MLGDRAQWTGGWFTLEKYLITTFLCILAKTCSPIGGVWGSMGMDMGHHGISVRNSLLVPWIWWVFQSAKCLSHSTFTTQPWTQKQAPEYDDMEMERGGNGARCGGHKHNSIMRVGMVGMDCRAQHPHKRFVCKLKTFVF